MSSRLKVYGEPFCFVNLDACTFARLANKPRDIASCINRNETWYGNRANDLGHWGGIIVQFICIFIRYIGNLSMFDMHCIFTVHSYSKMSSTMQITKKATTIEMQMIFLVSPGEWVFAMTGIICAHKLQYKYTIFLRLGAHDEGIECIFRRMREGGDCKMRTPAMALERLIRCIWQNMAFDLDANFYYCWCIHAHHQRTQLPTLPVAHDTHTHTRHLSNGMYTVHTCGLWIMQLRINPSEKVFISLTKHKITCTCIIRRSARETESHSTRRTMYDSEKLWTLYAHLGNFDYICCYNSLVLTNPISFVFG